MKIIISPAKKMQADDRAFLPKSSPVFFAQAQELWTYLQSLDQAELETVWRANAKITAAARQMLAADLTQGQLPA
ncbi:peroxide stress protein YaaA, partial [Lactobacillus nasalidis]